MPISCVSWCKNETLSRNGIFTVGTKEKEIWMKNNNNNEEINKKFV